MRKVLLISAAALMLNGIPLKAFSAATEPELQSATSLVHKKEYPQAYKQFKKMGDAGCPYSNCILGIMYEKGKGVEKNFDKAVSYYKKSVQLGLSDAELHLAKLYESEEFGLKKNSVLAMKWLKSAAIHGSAEAQLWLGKLYLKGAPGIKRDEFIASIWLRKAADQGMTEAKTLLAKANKVIPPDAIKKFDDTNNGQVSPLTTIAQSWGGYGDVAKTLELSNSN